MDTWKHDLGEKHMLKTTALAIAFAAGMTGAAFAGAAAWLLSKFHVSQMGIVLVLDRV